LRGVVPQHLRARFDALNELVPAAKVPEPWKQVSVVAIGGLTSIGFVESTDVALAASSAGRGVFDCRTGALLARADDQEFAFDIGNLLLAGIGPISGQRVRMSGIYGGGLACRTTDGWSIERHPLAWPDDELILAPPGQSMFWLPRGQLMRLTKLAGFVSEVRAFGFSPTGRSLVLATAADISIFGR
jgi:hypothetical protein